MNYKMRGMRRRIFAFVLAVVVFVTSLPIDTTQIFAATDAHPDVFTFAVTDGTTPIEGAVVKVYDDSEPAVLLGEYTTDANGEVVCQELTDLADSAVGHTYKYEVTKDGFDSVDDGTIVITDVLQVTDNVAVTLTPTLPEIADDTYTIENYLGVYDGQPHTVTVTSDECTFKYSEDEGVTYESDEAPTYIDAGEYTVYIQISKDGCASKKVTGTVKIEKAEIGAITFENGTQEVALSYDAVNGYPSYTNVASAVTPELTAAIVYTSSNTDTAEVSTSGEVQFKTPGQVTITASIAEAANYKGSTNSYIISCGKQPTTITFDNGEEVTVIYGENGNVYQNPLTTNSDGIRTFEIVSQKRGEEDVTDVATINETTGEVSILASGTVVVKVVIAESAVYQATEHTYTLHVEKAQQSGFAFDADSYSVVYGTLTETYVASGESVPGATTYKITSENDIAEINETTGEVTFKSEQGTFTITATNVGDNCYAQVTATCTVTVEKDESAFDFTNDTIAPVVEVSESPTGWNIDGVKISAKDGYKISKTDALDADWTDYVIFEEEGEAVEFNIYLRNESTLAISQAKKYGPYRLDTKAPYDLKIVYEETAPANILDAVALFFKDTVTVTLSAKDDVSGIDYFVYNYSNEVGDVTVEEVNLTVDANDPTIKSTSFRIDREYTGRVSFTVYDKAGLHESKIGEQIVIDKTPPGITVDFGGDTSVDGYYYKATRTATITINEANFDINDQSRVKIEVERKLNTENEFSALSVTPTFESTGNPTNPNEYQMTYDFVDNGDYRFKVSYTDNSGNPGIVNGEGTEYSSEFAIDTISPVLAIRYADGVTDDTYYFTDDRTATFTIQEHNFDATEIDVRITAVDVDNETIDLSEKDYVTYLTDPDSWLTTGDVHTASIDFDIEGHYTIVMTYTDKAGREQEVGTAISENFCIDKTAPDDMKISYSEGGIWQSILSTISFGFYQAEVTVTLEATDDIAKIARFDYVYSLSDDASANAQGDSGSFDASQLIFEEGNKKAKVSFDIPSQFRGHISFTAVNEAAKGDTISDDENRIVVDDDAPVVSVTYNNNIVLDGKYYKADRTATIKITEDNFFGTAEWNDAEGRNPEYKNGNLIITVGKRLPNETQITKTNVEPIFIYDDVEGCYKAEVLFDETAEYTFDIKYTDFSGNVYDNYLEDNFIVDKTKPVLGITYNADTASNDKYYKNNRTAKITVEDLSFNPANIGFVVTAVDANDVTVDISAKEYEAYLQDITNWTSDRENRDIYSAEIVFDIDANYEIIMTCTDMAENPQEEAIEEAFTVDKVDPQDCFITYSPSFLGKVIETITFGFYQAPVEVTLSAKDETSGIHSFVYSYGDVVNQAVTADAVGFTASGDSAEYKFTIAPQFRGKVSFIAVDKADRRTVKEDDTVIVVDNIAPGVSVEYVDSNSNPAVNETYYAQDRTAKIIIEEDNFFGAADYADGNLVIKVGKKLAADTDYTVTAITPEFSLNHLTGCYEATVVFDEEADYTFAISYTDYSGNPSDGYETAFTIDKTKPTLAIDYNDATPANGIYYKEDRIATITVTEHNFDPTDIAFVAEAVDVTGATVDLAAKGYVSYLRNIGSWTKNGDVYTAAITFDIEGMYTIGMEYVDLAGNPQVTEIADEFCVDKTIPQNAQITYSQSILDIVLQTVSFGFYQAPVEVTLTATDMIAGIDYFTYSYEVEAGADESNVGKTNVRVTNENLTIADGTATYNFEIQPQFRGTVSFNAVDKANNIALVNGTKVIIVDNVAPGVTVDYNNEEVQNATYYKANRTATISIKEANFFGTEEWGQADLYDLVPGTNEEYLMISVGKRLNDQTDYTVTKVKPVFTYDSASESYVAEVSFEDEADYTFDVKYTDRSGNVFDSYNVDAFTIDKSQPKLSVTYDNNTAVNDVYYAQKRTATFTVTEHNFDAKDISLDLKAMDVADSEIAVTDYEMYLKEASNWTSNGDVHTASITLETDAKYNYTLKYTDLAGNVQKDAITELFCIDQTAPTDIKLSVVKSDNTKDDVTGVADTIVFNKFYAAEVSVEIDANCDVSGLERIQYQKVNSTLDYSESGAWTDYNAETGIVVTPNEKFILYTKVTDKAGNQTIGNSTGIVVDNQLPIGETMAPEVDIIFEEPKTGEFYTENIVVNFAVIDPAVIGNPEPNEGEDEVATVEEDSNEEGGANTTEGGYYSGLGKVVCRLVSAELGKTGNRAKTIDLFEYGFSAETGELNRVEGAVYDDDKLANAWKGSVTIDAKEFSCNDLVVEIVAIDNAGNTRTSTTKAGDIKIDVTAPEVKVAVSNSDVDGENFFKADRTATITIKELNFAKENVKLTITNSDGEVPNISGWKSAGSGNNTTWTTEVYFNKDGDYEMNISFADKAGNKSKDPVYEGVSPQKFTIDKILPEIAVTYNNNDALNENYYKESRTATISIKEHNFDPERVTVTMTATDDGAGVAVPGVSGWSSLGDTHTATISYDNDALYTFDIAMKDKAGNESEDFAEQTFYVDKTVPELTIEGIEKFANNGTIAPVITFSDTNVDTSKAEIILEGVNRGRVELEGSYSDIHNGRIFRFSNFREEKEVDDIYTLTVNLTDKAGNTTTDSVKFSVNRFGSTYDLTEIADVNGKYVKEAKDLVITEVNVNELSNIKLTLFKNNQTIVLEEGIHYEIVMQGSEDQGYAYTYTVFKAICDEDGVYRLILHSEDAAGNIAENTLDVKDKEISFGIDSTVPNINITNLESKTTYVLDNLSVIMLANDNLLLDSITVYLDDFNTAYMTWNAAEIAEVLAGTGEFIFDIPGGSSSAHNVKVVCLDAAGNEHVVEINEFYVTTDAWVRYVNNKPLFYGSIGGGIGLIGMLVLFATRKGKKQENK